MDAKCKCRSPPLGELTAIPQILILAEFEELLRGEKRGGKRNGGEKETNKNDGKNGRYTLTEIYLWSRPWVNRPSETITWTLYSDFDDGVAGVHFTCRKNSWTSRSVQRWCMSHNAWSPGVSDLPIDLVHVPGLGRVTDVGTVHDQWQRFALIDTAAHAHTHARTPCDVTEHLLSSPSKLSSLLTFTFIA